MYLSCTILCLVQVLCLRICGQDKIFLTYLPYINSLMILLDEFKLDKNLEFATIDISDRWKKSKADI